jgi:hypothetical protein
MRFDDAREFAALGGRRESSRGDEDGAEEQLLLVEGGMPTRRRQVRYFQEPMFAGIYDLPALVR